MKPLLAALGTICLLALVQGAAAQEVGEQKTPSTRAGWYLGVPIDVMGLNSLKINTEGNRQRFDSRWAMIQGGADQEGVGIGLKVGYRFGKLRFEAEADWNTIVGKRSYLAMGKTHLAGVNLNRFADRRQHLIDTAWRRSAYFTQADANEFKVTDVKDWVTTDISLSTIMLNTLADLPGYKRLTPMVGLGIGLAQTRIKITYGINVRLKIKDAAYNHVLSEVGDVYNDEVLTLAYQALIGVSFKVSDKVSMVLAYRYLKLAELELDRPVISGTASLNAHSLGLEWHYLF